jgi:putative transcriptional regulator
MVRVIRLRLKEVLEERKMSQKELAEVSKVREPQISELVRNVRSSLNITYLQKIADALEIDDIRELMTIDRE